MTRYNEAMRARMGADLVGAEILSHAYVPEEDYYTLRLKQPDGTEVGTSFRYMADLINENASDKTRELLAAQRDLMNRVVRDWAERLDTENCKRHPALAEVVEDVVRDMREFAK